MIKIQSLQKCLCAKMSLHAKVFLSAYLTSTHNKQLTDTLFIIYNISNKFVRQKKVYLHKMSKKSKCIAKAEGNNYTLF